MDPGSSAAAHPPSPGILLPNVSRIRTDTSERNSPTGNGRSTTPTSTSTSARPKGKSKAKKRKTAKKSKVTGHPSVVIATSWTDRQEQFEEVRARKAIYCSQRSYAAAVDTLDTQENSKAWWIESVRIDKVRSKPRVQRPWEWSAEDCQTLMHDALSRPKETPEQSLEDRLGIDDEAAAPGLSCATKPASLPGDITGQTLPPSRTANVLGRKKKKTAESPRKKPPARRVRGRCNGSTGMQTIDALGSSSGVNGKGEVEASMVLTDDAPSAMEQEAVPAKHKKVGSTASSNANDKGNIRNNDPEVRHIDPLADDSSGDVDAMEDKEKARELSAALNRNIPRRGRFKRNPDTAEGGRELKAGGKERRSKSNKIGKSKRSASLMRKRLTINTGVPCGTSAVPFGQTVPRNELEVHPWKSAGLEFGLGTMAEVWWEDGKWYRCRISKISHEGRCGELEFLPNRRKIIAREFSTELDLDELIREAHLVLPGTHL
ncbi:unnamed protein product [Ascophyllum nodosum]